MMANWSFSEVAKAWTIQFYVILSIVCTANAWYGEWELLVKNAGIASMHTQVTHYGTVVLLDRTDIGPSQIPLPNGRCRNDPTDKNLTHDCTAHSVEFTPGPNTIRPLFIFTDTWCSSGQVTFNGTLVHTGGDSDGNKKVRTFAPCPPGGTCDWFESTEMSLQAGRWYATNHILEDGTTQVIIGGRDAITVEYIPNNNELGPHGQSKLEFLLNSEDYQNDTWYPFVNLLPDGNLWIFANKDSIIYNYKNNTVMKTLPTIPGGPRNYPSAGSSVMLPLSHPFSSVEVLLCGGAQLGAFDNMTKQFGAQQTCGRMILTDEDPKWVMEVMPFRRTMGDMILLPTKDVLIINGAQNGSQGWLSASNPAFHPLLYSVDEPAGRRFTVLAPTTIPRMYHSTANLLPDGRVLVAGSNPHQYYNFHGTDFPTELRVEAFSPPYLSFEFQLERPTIVSSPDTAACGSSFNISFFLVNLIPGGIEVTMASAAFATHSYSMGQRLLVLETSAPTETGFLSYQVTVTAPPNATIAPPGYYMTFVVNDGIPSVATWIQVSC